MTGIQFVTDEKGRKVAVQIDLKKHAAGIADLIGSVDGLPADLSERKKRYLKATGHGEKRAR